MIAPEIRRHIECKLASVAGEHGVRLLYAAESGSRAWGFGSPDSDFDVRFLYVHPRDWYIQLSEMRDVIERPLDEYLVDLAGWDIRKALRLLLKSNPALYEWLVSPMSYVGDDDFRLELKSMFEDHASPRALAFHYWSIARGQWKREIEGGEQVKLKKYFYVVRPLLSLGWVAEHGTPPPMHIEALRTAVSMPTSARAALDRMLQAKRVTPEFGTGPHDRDLDAWALAELERLHPERLGLGDRPRGDMLEQANLLFRRIIGV